MKTPRKIDEWEMQRLLTHLTFSYHVDLVHGLVAAFAFLNGAFVAEAHMLCVDVDDAYEERGKKLAKAKVIEEARKELYSVLTICKKTTGEVPDLLPSHE